MWCRHLSHTALAANAYLEGQTLSSGDDPESAVAAATKFIERHCRAAVCWLIYLAWRVDLNAQLACWDTTLADQCTTVGQRRLGIDPIENVHSPPEAQRRNFLTIPRSWHQDEWHDDLVGLSHLEARLRQYGSQHRHWWDSGPRCRHLLDKACRCLSLASTCIARVRGLAHRPLV